MEQVGPRLVFAPRRDTALVHLAHPLIQRALATLGRRRYPGQESVSRWTVRTGDVPSGAEALVLFTLEELAVNELRESFHHWIRTVALPVTRGKLGRYGLALLAISAGGGVFRYFMRRLIIGASRRVEYDLRSDFFAQLQRFPREYFDKARTGDLMSRASADLGAVRMMAGPAAMYAVSTGVLAIAAVGSVAWLAPRPTS
jgi:ABC-type multidrug transport system fused ATPase/permease subunit